MSCMSMPMSMYKQGRHLGSGQINLSNDDADAGAVAL